MGPFSAVSLAQRMPSLVPLDLLGALRVFFAVPVVHVVPAVPAASVPTFGALCYMGFNLTHLHSKTCIRSVVT
jgi:hypothetical protein